MQSTPSFNVDAMQADMVAKGWLVMDLARRARISHMTVARFFDGKPQTARTALKIAKALGKPLTAYLEQKSGVSA